MASYVSKAELATRYLEERVLASNAPALEWKVRRRWALVILLVRR